MTVKFPPTIVDVEVLNDTELLIQFSNQERRIYDVSQLFHLPQFQVLKDPNFLKQFAIEPGGYALAWNSEVDISENELWNNGVPTEQKISNGGCCRLSSGSSEISTPEVTLRSEISRFYGISIQMYPRDRVPPHFHAKYGENKASVDIQKVEIREGKLPKRARKLVLEWAQIHQVELLTMWQTKQFTNLDPLP